MVGAGATRTLPAPRPPSLPGRPHRGDSLRRSRVGVLGVATVMAIALTLRIVPWLKPHVFLGVMEYDDGVYYAASRSLLHGLVPYRDFTIVHPPLASILLLPAAAIGAAFGDASGMAAGRVEVVAAELANVWLVYRLTRGAVGGNGGSSRVAALFASMSYAVAPGAVAAGHTILLEPFTNLFALLAMWCLLRPASNARSATVSAAMSGGLLAAALGTKVFAAVYLAAAAIWLLATARRRLPSFAAGFGAAAAVIFGPVVVLAGPGRVWRDLVTTQLNRPEDGAVSVGARLRSLGGLAELRLMTALVLAAAIGVVAVVALAGARRHGLGSFGQLPLWAGLALLVAVAFVQSPSYFDHYAAFFAAPSAIALGIVVGIVLAASRGSVVSRLLVAALALALVVPAAVGSIRSDVTWRSSASMEAATALIPRGACVYADAVSLPVAADRFRVPSSGCPGWLDGRGQNLVWNIGAGKIADFYPSGFLADGRWQQQTLAQLSRAAFLLVRTDPTRMPEWTPLLRTYVARHFRLIWSAGDVRIPAQLWERS